MSDLLILRPYQRAALDAITDQILDGDVGRGVLVIPTGMGKTVIFAHLAAGFAGRTLILVHRDELVRQAVNKLRSVAPHLEVGIVQGAQNDVTAQIIVASVQTLSRPKRLAQLDDVGLIVVDECHHATANGYRTVLSAFEAANVVGFTATLSRNDSQQLSDIWEKVIFRMDILDGIEGGFLCDVAGRRVTVDGLTLDEVVNGLTLDEVVMRGGDFAPASLSEALMQSNAIKATVEAYREYADGMSTVLFAPTVEAAREFQSAFNDAGVRAGLVHGSMAKDERRWAIELFDAGKLSVLVNCMVLTEGWDSPRAQCAIIARPTLSAALYVQMVGRVLRPFPGKDRALVLDVAGASEMHPLATLADLTSRRISDVVLDEAEGLSLREIVHREIERGSEALKDYAVSSYEVDLFNVGGALWLQTKKGVWFISTKDHLYFLWPGTEPGTYRVGKRPIRGRGGSYVVQDVDFETAMSWAEQVAREDDEAHGGATLTLKNASWRKGRQRASEGQLNLARQLKLQVTENSLKRDVADMITVELASRALDKTL